MKTDSKIAIGVVASIIALSAVAIPALVISSRDTEDAAAVHDAVVCVRDHTPELTLDVALRVGLEDTKENLRRLQARFGPYDGRNILRRIACSDRTYATKCGFKSPSCPD